jgi:thiamine-monophosphate kinase
LSLSEFDVIAKYFSRARASGTGVVFGIGDDAAIIRPRNGIELVVSADVLNENVHFPANTPARAIGHKALAVNLSDIAAMGAEPFCFTVTLSLPTIDEAWLGDFSTGLFEIADSYGVELIGGDTVRGPLSVAIQIIGQVAPGMALRRSGARNGDKIYVSGTLGDGAAALELLNTGSTVPVGLQSKLDFPQPRTELGRQLLGLATSCIDISDGVLADLNHILAASEVSGFVDVDKLPLSDELAQLDLPGKQGLVLAGGDDYELCFTVPEDRVHQLESISRELGCRLTCIGEIAVGSGLQLRQFGKIIAGKPVTGFDHFPD